MRSRTDSNQGQIVEDLRRVGMSVHVTSNVGDGFPDLVTGGIMPCPLCRRRFRQTKLIEVKSQVGILTPDQQEFHHIWRGQLDVARTSDEALRIVGVRKEIGLPV